MSVQLHAPPARQELRVSATTDIKDLAWSICRIFAEGKYATLTTVGTSALNQAVKAVAIANSRDATHGRFYVALPAMDNINLKAPDGSSIERTMIRLSLLPLAL